MIRTTTATQPAGRRTSVLTPPPPRSPRHPNAALPDDPTPAPRPPTAQPRGPRGSFRPGAAPRLPPLLGALTRRPEDDARLRRLRTLLEPPEEPPEEPPGAVGVRLLWCPELKEDGVKLGLRAELGSDVVMELLWGGRKGRPLHGDTVPQPLHTDTVPQPLHTVPQPLHTVPQPLHSDTVPQPLHAVTQPLHTVPQPLHTNAAVESVQVLQGLPRSSNTTPGPAEALWALYGQLGPALPSHRLCFDAEPLLEPAPTAPTLPAASSQRQHRGAPNSPAAPPQQPRPSTLLKDYLQFLTSTGSDFLRAIFNLRAAETDEEPPDEHPRVTAEPPPPAAPAPKPEELQHRLQRLWASLRVPVGQRLAMATKYGPAAARRRLTAALELWDEAAALIRRRERLLALLEGMELQSSDPNRFFQRLPGLPSVATLHGETRRRLNAVTLRCEGELRAVLKRLREEYGDVVTLRGRCYEEKMRRDRGEMLYRLQQGRRAAAMGGIVQPRLGGR